MFGQRIKAWGRVGRFFIGSYLGSRCKILDSNHTVDIILKGRSLIRFGDGEFGIYKKRSIHYQKWSENLLHDFDRIKEDYLSGNESYILAVPKYFMTISGFELMRKRAFVAAWSEARFDFVNSFPQDKVYGDAFLFQKDNESIYGRIWREDEKRKNVIFIHNDIRYAKEFSEKYRKETFFVQCPDKNAYEKLSDIICVIDGIIANKSLSISDTELVISAGPAGKIIAYIFTKKGYLCVDTGHCWDNPLRGRAKK